jgi:hypothetical protein
LLLLLLATPVAVLLLAADANRLSAQAAAASDRMVDTPSSNFGCRMNTGFLT